MASDEAVIEAYLASDPMLSVADICDKLVISPNRIYAVCRKYDVETRRQKGISVRTKNPSVLEGYSDDVREMIRVMRSIEHTPMTVIAAKLQMPYEHVRRIAARIKADDQKAIEGVDSELIMEKFKAGTDLDELRHEFNLTATQLLMVLDSERGSPRFSDWGRMQAVVEEVLDRLRTQLRLQDGQQPLL